MDKINFGKYVELAYEILVVDNQGEAQVFKFDREHPDCFVFGQDLGMIEGFARHIEGLEQGASFDFTLAPAEAFGERIDDMVLELEKSIFNVEGEFDSEKVYVGAWVPMQTDEGYRVNGLVTDVTDDKVTLDFNHQLAGETVRYQGEVLLVRDATPEELNPKHGCGCGCDHDHCGHDHCDHDHCGHDHEHGHDCNCDGCNGCE